MQFKKHKFSNRFPEVECAVFVIHESVIPGGRYRGTAAAIVLPDGRFWKGITLCSPEDQFVRKVGRAKAIRRAYQAMREAPNVPHGEVELNNNGEEAKKFGTDWSGRLKSCLLVEIDEFRLDRGVIGQAAEG